MLGGIHASFELPPHLARPIVRGDSDHGISPRSHLRVKDPSALERMTITQGANVFVRRAGFHKGGPGAKWNLVRHHGRLTRAMRPDADCVEVVRRALGLESPARLFRCRRLHPVRSLLEGAGSLRSVALPALHP